jgi:hypothetical protein
LFVFPKNSSSSKTVNINLSTLRSDKLRASPERSEGEDQFSGERPKEFAGKLTVLAETLSKPKMNLSERSVDKLENRRTVGER